MRFFDFSSWQTILTSILGILLFSLIAMGIRVMMMLTIQQRQQRMNRQINERLRVLIAAYKVLGGSFTGRLTVDPAHLGRSRRADPDLAPDKAALDEPPLDEAAPENVTLIAVDSGKGADPSAPPTFVLERRVQIRDAVEAALADILLLGTETQVELAARAAADMAAGRPIHTAELVVSLRDYIRRALDLEKIPAKVAIPAQGGRRDRDLPAAEARAAAARAEAVAPEAGRGAVQAAGQAAAEWAWGWAWDWGRDGVRTIPCPQADTRNPTSGMGAVRSRNDRRFFAHRGNPYSSRTQADVALAGKLIRR